MGTFLLASSRLAVNRLASGVRTAPARVFSRGVATPSAGSSSMNGVQKLAVTLRAKAGEIYASGVLSELRPPTPMEIPKAIKDLVRLFRERNYKNITMREAWLNTLVTTEVICWFFAGEIIGKGTLIGYQV